MNNKVLMKRDFNKWKAGTDQFDPRYVFESAWLIQQDKIDRLTEALKKVNFYAATGCLQDSFDEIKRISSEALKSCGATKDTTNDAANNL